ncbi:MAG: NAD-binding protein, partial [Pseudomonadales bacterium]
MFARAGVVVTIISRRGLLPEAEPEIGEALTTYFGDEGINVISGISYEKIEAEGKTVVLTVQDQGQTREISAEKVL